MGDVPSLNSPTQTAFEPHKAAKAVEKDEDAGYDIFLGSLTSASRSPSIEALLEERVELRSDDNEEPRNVEDNNNPFILVEAAETTGKADEEEGSEENKGDIHWHIGCCGRRTGTCNNPLRKTAKNEKAKEKAKQLREKSFLLCRL